MVSIVIPVYNVQTYLPECIRSVLKLKTENEVILIDDGSTDNSGAVCDEWAGKYPNIKVVHQENGGLSAARNTGIRIASGEYVMFLDSDDFIDPEETDCMLQKVGEGADIVLGLYRNYFSEEDRYENEKCRALLSIEGMMPVDEFLAAIPADGQESYMIACRFVVRKTFLDDHDLLFMRGIYHEDEEWTARLLCSARNIYVTHHYFYQYRQARVGAITSKIRPRNIWDRFTIMEQMHNQMQQMDSGSVKYQYLKQRMGQLYLSNMLDSRVLSKEDWNKAEDYFQRFAVCASALAGKAGAVVKLCKFAIGTKMTCALLKVAYKVLGKS